MVRSSGTSPENNVLPPSMKTRMSSRLESGSGTQVTLEPPLMFIVEVFLSECVQEEYGS